MAKDDKGHGSEKGQAERGGAAGARAQTRAEGAKRSDARPSKPINAHGDTFKPKSERQSVYDGMSSKAKSRMAGRDEADRAARGKRSIERRQKMPGGLGRGKY